MIKGLRIVAVMALAAAGLLNYAGARTSGKAGTAALLQRAAPKNWTVKDAGKIAPLEWLSQDKCSCIQMRNPAVTHKSLPGNFDYNPFYDVWICPEKFNGDQKIIRFIEQKYPAKYVGDSPKGVLFIFTLGENDWENGVADIAKVLGISQPEKKESPNKAQENFLKSLTPAAGGVIKLDAATKSSLILTYFAPDNKSNEDVEKDIAKIAENAKENLIVEKRLVININYKDSFGAKVIWIR